MGGGLSRKLQDQGGHLPRFLKLQVMDPIYHLHADDLFGVDCDLLQVVAVKIYRIFDPG